MTNKTILQYIVTEEVKKTYSTEKEFYENVIGTTQQSWNRWKKGERGFSEDKMTHIKALFSPYEWMLIQQISSILTTYQGEFDTDYYSFYQEHKVNLAKEWIEKGALMHVINIKKDPRIINIKKELSDIRKYPEKVLVVENKLNNEVVNISDKLIFNLKPSSLEIPVDKQKQLEWFDEHIHSVMV